ncbi:Putative pyridoxal phosphate-dependent aminotransferase EpsN [Roseovarius sp. THAF9]|uniref:DegT/DnrJ/EryC1/StrS family aminotransferase n=1 Tax=Roseovarius sp. THAF9 TaxID=2587847 RepID=UPI0012697D04|nr:DegT/DnrJ/EryC1/StrS aminotransferase family protein [Roseovarius sp. THAF9]QFT91354.1 Putative pyridoxal phosphate-dependent aminotransferase EpsN [Roseovarius sp. THAF9]
MTASIAYTKPSITELEVSYAEDAARHGWGPKCYDYIIRFEALFREHIGTSFGIATSSCTGAMQMGLKAMGIGPGDEVILADTNWIATAAPIVQLGATPIFVDILPDSWCIDPDATEKAITPHTRAIVATHLYGNLCDMDALLKLAKRYGIPVIEDAAEAIGASYRESPAGSMGLFSTFSFHGTKTLTTGEGGMFLTSDGELYEKVLTLSNHGRDRQQNKQFWADEVGYKFKMSNLQAALGCAQMERIAELTDRKRAILHAYKAELAALNGISMNPEPDHVLSGAWMPTVVFDESLGIRRDAILSVFRAAQIDARVFFYPLSSQPMFQPVPDNETAWSICERAINLPSFHAMTDADIARVCKVIRDLLAV